jgi:8-oxo-dGTP pyrophosphatase MutT (NUDIX family)
MDPSSSLQVTRVRGLVLTDRQTIFLIERNKPGVPVYYSIPGGGIEPTDETAVHALQRELLEELGATVACIEYLGSGLCDGELHGLYRTQLVSIDPNTRSGPELSSTGRGTYTVVELPFTREALQPLRIGPESLVPLLFGLMES